MQIFTSIIIPTFNRNIHLQKCIEALCSLSYPFDSMELIVVDDGSTDATPEVCLMMQRKSPMKMVYFRLERNSGAGAARNVGLQNAKGEIVAFLDDDCLVKPDWLDQIIETFKKHPEATSVGGAIRNPDDTPLAWASYILEFSEWFPTGHIRKVRNIPTCNIAYKKNEIQSFSFRALPRAVFEDSLFNYELTRRGKNIIFNPAIGVDHQKWNETFTKRAFLRSQIYYARGFINRGYLVCGIGGKLLMQYRFLNLLCPRLVFVFLRCLSCKTYVKKFFLHFKLILAGEFARGKFLTKHIAC